jgi:hypothetical protein
VRQQVAGVVHSDGSVQGLGDRVDIEAGTDPEADQGESQRPALPIDGRRPDSKQPGEQEDPGGYSGQHRVWLAETTLQQRGTGVSKLHSAPRRQTTLQDQGSEDLGSLFLWIVEAGSASCLVETP